MYNGISFDRSELGDIDVIKHDGIFHLFHLILPNHDYIAHAVSENAFFWKRVKNAIFIGEPESWDDDMLWTMHVSKHPTKKDLWRMFYTGICRREKGRVQRIGMAVSNDLYKWEKRQDSSYPLSIPGPFYESSVHEGRHWVSCRDPYYYSEKGKGYVLVNARVPYGPMIRRGCVGIAQEIELNRFEWLPPLFFPGAYDDIEVPVLYKAKNKYYLFGGIREDVKIHYWYSKSMFGPYRAFTDNVLMPQGNYALRVTKHEDKLLAWNFFNTMDKDKITKTLPPPKEISIDSSGRIKLKSFSGFKLLEKKCFNMKSVFPIFSLLQNQYADFCNNNNTLSFISESGYEFFVFKQKLLNFKMNYNVKLVSSGKTGILLRTDRNGNGYFISLDLQSGITQARLWKESEDHLYEKDYDYEVIQDSKFNPTSSKNYMVQVIVCGTYYELCINEKVILSYVDSSITYEGYFGFYVESSHIEVKNLRVSELESIPKEFDALV